MIAAACIALSCAGSHLSAGPLDPPAGAIASTPGPEPRTPISAATTPGDADSVYRITTPGSYYLPGSFIAPAGKSGIEIAASNVTIDLNGFTITSLATLEAIRLSVDGRSNIVIRNGNIGFCVGGGIDIQPGFSGAVITLNATIENVHVNNVTGTGIRAGHVTTFANVTVQGCSGVGIFVGNRCRFVDCVVDQNSGAGVFAGDATSLSGCVMSQNGTQGLVANNASSVVNCSFYDNGSSGCSLTRGCSVTGSTAYSNGDEGFITTDYCILAHCTARGNGAVGINVGSGCEVSACVANTNGDHGIECFSRCAVKDCVSQGNGTAVANGAGIHAASGGNRLEANHCSVNDIGIDVDTTGNIVIRNTCAANTLNWSIAANNYYGPIINREGAATPSVAGDSAANALGTTDPNANFTH